MKRLFSAALLPILLLGQETAPLSNAKNKMPFRLVTFDQRSTYAIVYPDGADFSLKSASSKLKNAVKKATGAELPFYSESAVPDGTTAKRRFIRVGFSEDVADVRDLCGTSLLARDHAVFEKDGNFCIAAGSEECYADAILALVDEFTFDGEWVLPQGARFYRDEYAYAVPNIGDRALSDFSLCAENRAGERVAEEFAARLREECGLILAVSTTADTADKSDKPDKPDKSEKNEKNEKTEESDTRPRIVFGAGDGLLPSQYAVVYQNGMLAISSPSGEGLAVAAEEVLQKFSKGETTVGALTFSGTLSKSEIYADEIAYRAPLTHTAMRLANDKQLTVAYFGGSVTDGYGASKPNETSWRALTSAWLADNFPDADIREVNAAIGASGSRLGRYRVERDVISQKPDLLFVEFAINDVYCGETALEAKEGFESVIRSVKKALPDCDIVAVYTTDDYRVSIGGTYEQMTAHESVAAYYDLPSVNVGGALARTKSLSGSRSEAWKTYYLDIVHPLNAGYREYAATVCEFLRNELLFGENSTETEETGNSEETAGTTAKPLPTPLCAGADAEMLYDIPNESMLADTQGYTLEKGVFLSVGKTPYTDYLSTSGENSLTYTFEGNEIALFTSDFSDGMLTYSIDGESRRPLTVTAGNMPIVLAKDLADGTHTLTLSAKVPNGKTFRIGAFLSAKK